MTVDAIQCELMLLDWAERARTGGKLVFQIAEDELEPFKSLTLTKGKRAGQRFMAVLALINDDETAAKLPTGPLCRLAAIWCKERQFQDWAARLYPSLWAEYSTAHGVSEEGAAKGVVCRICGVDTRKQIDTNGEAKRAFNELIRAPYMRHLHGQ